MRRCAPPRSNATSAKRITSGRTGADGPSNFGFDGPSGVCRSGDGGVIPFPSGATDIEPGDSNAVGDVFLETFRPTTYGFCYGDGTGPACPCANSGSPEKGCDNSLATGGALRLGVGTTSVTHDAFLPAASTLPPNTAVLFFQGTMSVATAFGDGIRCAGGPVARLGERTANAAGDRAFGFGIAGDAPVSILGSVPASGGTRTYQAWYRNAAGYCTPSTFNLSNGLSVLWTS